jgi:hypothetical protein
MAMHELLKTNLNSMKYSVKTQAVAVEKLEPQIGRQAENILICISH